MQFDEDVDLTGVMVRLAEPYDQRNPIDISICEGILYDADTAMDNVGGCISGDTLIASYSGDNAACPSPYNNNSSFGCHFFSESHRLLAGHHYYIIFSTDFSLRISPYQCIVSDPWDSFYFNRHTPAENYYTNAKQAYFAFWYDEDLPIISDDDVFSFNRHNYFSLAGPMTISVPFYYLPQVFTSEADTMTVYQCAGENYDVPNCATGALTLVGTSTVWSAMDIALHDPDDTLLTDISGISSYPMEVATSGYRTYAAYAYSTLFGNDFGPVYFSVDTTLEDVEDWFSDGEYDRDYYCSEANVCAGMATSTLGGIVGCGIQRAACWAFYVSTSSKGYFSDSVGIIKKKFPINLFTDLTEAFSSVATTSAETGIYLPIPTVDDGKASITYELLISASTTKEVIGLDNYTNIRLGITWFLWIVAGVYIYKRLNI
jgi:hypothetical protein